MFIGFDYYEVCVILYRVFSFFFVIYSCSPALFEIKGSHSQIKILVTHVLCIFFMCYVTSVCSSSQKTQPSEMSCKVELNFKHIGDMYRTVTSN